MQKNFDLITDMAVVAAVASAIGATAFPQMVFIGLILSISSAILAITIYFFRHFVVRGDEKADVEVVDNEVQPNLHLSGDLPVESQTLPASANTMSWLQLSTNHWKKSAEAVRADFTILYSANLERKIVELVAAEEPADDAARARANQGARMWIKQAVGASEPEASQQFTRKTKKVPQGKLVHKGVVYEADPAKMQ